MTCRGSIRRCAFRAGAPRGATPTAELFAVIGAYHLRQAAFDAQLVKDAHRVNPPMFRSGTIAASLVHDIVGEGQILDRAPFAGAIEHEVHRPELVAACTRINGWRSHRQFLALPPARAAACPASWPARGSHR